MERRVTQKVDGHIRGMKTQIQKHVVDALEHVNRELEDDKEMKNKVNSILTEMMREIYDMPQINLGAEDFAKRKRAKNVVPFYDRCRAKRANNEQCTRRKRADSLFCGTHSKGTPHGIVETEGNEHEGGKQVQVCAVEISGIMYYIDGTGNVYEAEDIMQNKSNPKVIAKYEKNMDSDGNNVYTIPEYNI